MYRRHLDHGRDNINGELRSVLTGRGPKCVNKKAVSTDGSLHVRRVVNLYYTWCFANMVYREVVMPPGPARRGHEVRAAADCNVGWRPGQPRAREQQVHVEGGAGCLHVSPARALVTEHLQEFSKEGEFHTLSIDCTVKIALATIGQAPQAHVRKRPSAAAFAESERRRKVLTVRGLTGAVLLLSCVREESADEMAQALQKGISTDHRQRVKFVATDKPSSKMFVVLKQALPNLQCLNLDTVHVSMRYESAIVCSKSARSFMLRRLMSKFTCVPSALSIVRFSATALSRSGSVFVGTTRGSSLQCCTWDWQTRTHSTFVRSAGCC